MAGVLQMHRDYNSKTGEALRYDHFLGHASHYLGIFVMLTAFVRGAYILYRQYVNRDSLTGS